MKLTPINPEGIYIINPGSEHTFEFEIKPIQITTLSIQHIDAATQDASLRASIVDVNNFQMLFSSDNLDVFNVPRVERKIQIIDSLIKSDLPSLPVGKYYITIQNQQNAMNSYRFTVN